MTIELEDIGSNPAPRATIGEIIEARFSRRSALLGAAAAWAIGIDGADAQTAPREGGPSTLTFPELRHQLAQTDAVAEGHEKHVVIRWGDPVLPDAPAFDPRNVTAAKAQAKQFGYNNDFIADFFPPERGSRIGEHGPALGREPRIHQHQPDVPGHRHRQRGPARVSARSRRRPSSMAHGMAAS
jgi:secreted PhoX family phosphatase